ALSFLQSDHVHNHFSAPSSFAQIFEHPLVILFFADPDLISTLCLLAVGFAAYGSHYFRAIAFQLPCRFIRSGAPATDQHPSFLFLLSRLGASLKFVVPLPTRHIEPFASLPSLLLGSGLAIVSAAGVHPKFLPIKSIARQRHTPSRLTCN